MRAINFSLLTLSAPSIHTARGVEILRHLIMFPPSMFACGRCSSGAQSSITGRFNCRCAPRCTRSPDIPPFPRTLRLTDSVLISPRFRLWSDALFSSSRLCAPPCFHSKVDGFKRLVKNFASAVTEYGGLVIYVNLGAPTREWDSVFDYHGARTFPACQLQLAYVSYPFIMTAVDAPTDSFVQLVEKQWRKTRPQDFQAQQTLGDSFKVVVSGAGAGASAKWPKDQAEKSKTAREEESQTPKKAGKKRAREEEEEAVHVLVSSGARSREQTKHVTGSSAPSPPNTLAKPTLSAAARALPSSMPVSATRSGRKKNVPEVVVAVSRPGSVSARRSGAAPLALGTAAETEADSSDEDHDDEVMVVVSSTSVSSWSRYRTSSGGSSATKSSTVTSSAASTPSRPLTGVVAASRPFATSAARTPLKATTSLSDIITPAHPQAQAQMQARAVYQSGRTRSAAKNEESSTAASDTETEEDEPLPFTPIDQRQPMIVRTSGTGSDAKATVDLLRKSAAGAAMLPKLRNASNKKSASSRSAFQQVHGWTAA